MHPFSRRTAAIRNGDRTREVGDMSLCFYRSLYLSANAMNTRPVVVENSFAQVRSKSEAPATTDEHLDSIDTRIFTLGMSSRCVTIPLN
jgi:hypothetical protein